jgi:hypothetical protein
MTGCKIPGYSPPQPPPPPPDPNLSPGITSAPVTQANFNEVYQYQAGAEDPDGDTLHWSLTAGPAGLQIDPGTGLLAGQGMAAGQHAVSMRVEDGQGGADTQSFTLSIYAGPLILSSPVRYTYAGTAYRYQVEAVDTHDLDLYYTLTQGPAGMSITATGMLEWMAETAGTFTIEITVANSQGSSTIQDYSLTILNPDSIVLVSEPVSEGYVSLPYRYRLSAIDADGSGIVYFLNHAPPGMNINAGSGLIEWLPATAGTYSVEAAVVNAAGYTDTQSFSVTVYTLEQMDSMFNAKLDGLFQNLIDDNMPAAMQYLTRDAQQRLRPLFDDLLPYMEEVSSNYTDAVRISLNPHMAEYMIRRTGGAGNRVFMVTYLRDFDGVWKINDL